MPTSVYVESPDSPFSRLKPNLDGSIQVNVNNPVTSTTVSGAVSVSNFPSVQAVTGTVSVAQPVAVTGTVAIMGQAPPAAGDIVSASRDTTGVMYTVPAGRVFQGSVSLSACVAVAGNSQPSISTPAGTIHKITVNGLALVSVANSSTIGDVYIHGGASGVAVTFTAGASGTSTGQIAGRLL